MGRLVRPGTAASHQLIEFYFILLLNFIYFWLHWVFFAAHGLSLVEWGLLFLVVRGLLIAVASLVAEHGL